MLVLRLPLRLAARAAPSPARVATPIVASSISATRSYSAKADGTTTPKKKKAALSKKAQKEADAKAAYKLLSPEEKAQISAKAKEAKKKEDVKLLKAQALTPPKYRQLNAWSVYVKENSKSNSGPVSENIKTLAQEFKNLSSSEKEHINHLVTEYNAKSLREFQEWLNGHTPAQILEANVARARLRRLVADSGSKYALIKDPRLIKKPTSSYLHYHTERLASGDFRGIGAQVSAKDIAKEFKALSASEKKKYEDLAAKDIERYHREHLEVYGFEVPASTKASKTTSVEA
ncbi:hypothetical protein QM012_006876 [Aureobasidium pullulans]|uniref:HMG box domain-containing protein n=1 Tax=Aureobasidium pullulans TaxID=5580 RepID=A0ABR0TPW8_AURPU